MPCWPPPASDIPALDLAAGRPGLVPSGSGPLLDATARNTYRHRIRQLDDELAAADRTGDSIAAGQAYRERQALISELHRATGLAGRPHRASPDVERARLNVTRTLRATIDRITLAAPIAGAHLASSIRTGTMCRYQPPRAGRTAGTPDRRRPTANRASTGPNATVKYRPKWREAAAMLAGE